MAEPFYITTAISYPNGKPHIGHAYEAIAADVIARFQRQLGRDVRFQTGTDEHGLKMAQKARDLGISPKQLADDMCDGLNVSYDVFMRTSEPRHHAATQELWRRMEASGDLYLDRYEGWYSIRDEAYYDASELIDGEGGVSSIPIIEAWNKWDMLSEERRLELGGLAAADEGIVPLSAANGDGVTELVDRLDALLTDGAQVHRFYIPIRDGRKLAWLHAHGDVLVEEEAGEGPEGPQWRLDVRLTSREFGRFSSL